MGPPQLHLLTQSETSFTITHEIYEHHITALSLSSLFHFPFHVRPWQYLPDDIIQGFLPFSLTRESCGSHNPLIYLYLDFHDPIFWCGVSIPHTTTTIELKLWLMQLSLFQFISVYMVKGNLPVIFRI